MKRHLRFALVLLVLVSLGGCEQGEEGIEPSKLRLLVLQPSDVGSGFVQFEVGPQELLDHRSGPRGNPRRFGRQGGWTARYRRATRAQAGPLVVESRADVFRDEPGAEMDIEAYEEEFGETLRDSRGRAQLVPVPSLGDRVTAMTFVQGTGRRAVRYFRIAWREGNVSAFVGVNGFDASLSLTDALQLAGKQQRRIRAAEPR